jgi:hypothetical protein
MATRHQSGSWQMRRRFCVLREKWSCSQLLQRGFVMLRSRNPAGRLFSARNMDRHETLSPRPPALANKEEGAGTSPGLACGGGVFLFWCHRSECQSPCWYRHMNRPRAAREKMSEWVLHCAVNQRHIRRSQPTRAAALKDACSQLLQGHAVNRIVGPNETINAERVKDWCAKHRLSSRMQSPIKH